jgi:ferredoxin
MCQSEVPEVFGYDGDADQATVLLAEPRPELHDAVRRAAKYCPAMAIEISEA